MDEYTNKSAFINRAWELKLLVDFINEEPKKILFIYGPRSSGKTTLLYKFVNENLFESGYDIKYFNLREILIANYNDFIQTFFETGYSGAANKKVKEKRGYNLGVFKLDVEVMKDLNSKKIDPFVVMKKELIKLNDTGVRPVIIIDELQALEDIYLNGQRELIKELFNFFVAMTKESHLCHIIVSSSDGYFINKIYNDSRLRKTSDFLSIEYLEKEDIYYWLNNIEKESNIKQYKLTSCQIDKIWNNFAGSPWEVSEFLGSLLTFARDNQVSDEDVDKVLQRKLIAARSMFEYYAGLHKKKVDLFKEINILAKKQVGFKEKALVRMITENQYNEEELRGELNSLVKNNFLAFDPVTGEYKVQGKSMEIALNMYINDL